LPRRVRRPSLAAQRVKIGGDVARFLRANALFGHAVSGEDVLRVLDPAFETSKPLDFWTPWILILRTGGDDGKPNFSDAFKRDAVAQITERGYPVAEVSQRLGVSQHSLYAWKRQLAGQVSGDEMQSEIRVHC
jgi:hypothetical protein